MFTEKTIKRLAEIGIKPTGNKGQYCDKTLAVFVYENTEPTYIRDLVTCVSITAYHYPFDRLAYRGHTLRYIAMQSLKLAERAEEIIKENGK